MMMLPLVVALSLPPVRPAASPSFLAPHSLTRGTSSSASLVDCASPQADSLSRLLNALQRLPGQFVRGSTGARTYEFVGERSLLGAFAAFGDSAVRRLADCLDSREPAAAIAKGRRVALGTMCYVALTTIAYHEATDESGDSRGGWAGVVLSPVASAARMRAAKRAWLTVVREHAYVLN